MKKGILLLCNIILILGSVLSVFIYSENFRKENRKMQMETFSSTIESMKKVSENYLYTERGYVDNWAGNHLLTLINDILDISKVESGKMELDIRPFSITEAAEAFVENCGK